MVLISSILLNKGKTSSLIRQRYDQNWLDKIRVYVKGGSGGNGLPKVGGVGGSGGNIYVEADKTVKDLKKIIKQHPTKRITAGSGGDSRKIRLLGEIGDDVSIKVPLGVSVTTDEGEQLGDLLHHGDKCVVAKGGVGGFEASQFMGTRGEKRSVRLNLKLLGDVGFVGFPNAGKSTLLKAISRAKPKIANYPFTTLRPNIGVCEFEDFRRISFVDLPGLIEGAHQNLGLGHQFLKHVERTRILLFVIDVTGFQFKSASPIRSALETILILNKELELYKDELIKKPAICAITKMDTPGAEEKFETLTHHLNDIDNVITDTNLVNPEFVPTDLIKFADIIPISAKFSPKTVQYLKQRVREVIDDYEDEENELMMQADKLSQALDSKLAEKSNIF